MNVYKVSRTDRIDWDEYDAFVCVANDFVCVANDEAEARNMHPDSEWGPEFWDSGNPRKTGWVKRSDAHTLNVDLVGTANGPARIILSSYCAG